MIITPRTKIRLARHLHAQTTPYPHVNSWIKRGIAVFVLAMAAGVYIAAKPSSQTGEPSADKEILGEQQPAALEIYEVQRGDTLFNVSQKYGISWQTVAQINNLKEPYILKAGQKLKIPSK